MPCAQRIISPRQQAVGSAACHDCSARRPWVSDCLAACYVVCADQWQLKRSSFDRHAAPRAGQEAPLRPSKGFSLRGIQEQARLASACDRVKFLIRRQPRSTLRTAAHRFARLCHPICDVARAWHPPSPELADLACEHPSPVLLPAFHPISPNPWKLSAVRLTRVSALSSFASGE
jgi:hypothetical protein